MQHRCYYDKPPCCFPHPKEPCAHTSKVLFSRINESVRRIPNLGWHASLWGKREGVQVSVQVSGYRKHLSCPARRNNLFAPPTRAAQKGETFRTCPRSQIQSHCNDCFAVHAVGTLICDSSWHQRPTYYVIFYPSLTPRLTSVWRYMDILRSWVALHDLYYIGFYCYSTSPTRCLPEEHRISFLSKSAGCLSCHQSSSQREKIHTTLLHFMAIPVQILKLSCGLGPST